MRYFSRAEIEKIGRAGTYWDIEDGVLKARVLSSFWLYCDPDDLGFTPHMTILGDGFWESWITKWMSENVKPGSRCIDAGANMGYYSMFLADHGCEVIAIEPQPHLAKLIGKSANANLADVRVDENAIGNQSGANFKMHVPRGHGMNASIAYTPISPEGFDIIDVDLYSLDEYCEGRQYYDFIKVDVEGAEDQVFYGAQEFIEENPDCVWLIEFRWDRLAEPEEFAKLLFEKMEVSYVDYQGNENSLVAPEQLASQKNEDWMLVLRSKK